MVRTGSCRRPLVDLVVAWLRRGAVGVAAGGAPQQSGNRRAGKRVVTSDHWSKEPMRALLLMFHNFALWVADHAIKFA